MGEDCPEGYEKRVEMLKAQNCCLCKDCYYLKRGSLNNMKQSELITNLNENESFNDKQLGLFNKS